MSSGIVMPVHKRTPIGLKRAAKAAGSKYALARLLGITAQSLNKWNRIPRKRILQIEKLTGVPREKLAPELYRAR